LLRPPVAVGSPDHEALVTGPPPRRASAGGPHRRGSATVRQPAQGTAMNSIIYIIGLIVVVVVVLSLLGFL
jgi:hypothetical protein